MTKPVWALCKYSPKSNDSKLNHINSEIYALPPNRAMLAVHENIFIQNVLHWAVVNLA
jgi:hypothetical protein